MSKARKLPGKYESKYKSQHLKEQIANDGMWVFIPGIDYSMDSKKGMERIEGNDPLFRFIDTHFLDGPFAFEPNMMDGRFMFLPDNVSHQGIGICVSQNFPRALEVGSSGIPANSRKKRFHSDQHRYMCPCILRCPRALMMLRGRSVRYI